MASLNTYKRVSTFPSDLSTHGIEAVRNLIAPTHPLRLLRELSIQARQSYGCVYNGLEWTFRPLDQIIDGSIDGCRLILSVESIGGYPEPMFMIVNKLAGEIQFFQVEQGQTQMPVFGRKNGATRLIEFNKIPLMRDYHLPTRDQIVFDQELAIDQMVKSQSSVPMM